MQSLQDVEHQSMKLFPFELLPFLRLWRVCRLILRKNITIKTPAEEMCFKKLVAFSLLFYQHCYPIPTLTDADTVVFG